MKTRNTSTKLITITMAALAAAGLLCGAGWLQPVAAQSGDGSVKFVSYASIGIVLAQRVRLSVGNTEGSAGNLTLSFSFYLAHGSNSSSSVPLYESELIRVPPGEFRFSDVSREDLNTEGEPGTGRAQVMVIATIMAPAGSNPGDYPVSMEVIRKETGGTSEALVLHEYGHGMDPEHTFIPEAAFIGFIPGQRLSFSVLNPPEEGGAPVRAQAYIYDATGRVISRSAEVDLRPGQIHTFEFNRDDLPLAGEEGTRRLQVRAGVQVAFMDGSVRHVKLPVSMELVDNGTGATVVIGGDYFTGTVTVSGDGD